MFAPWRLEVIETYKSTASCILCNILKMEDDEEALILERAEESFVLMNKFPYSNGHLMFVPNRHVKEWSELTAQELEEMMRLSQKAVKVLRDCFQCEAFNLGANLGAAAGAGIPDHLHLHLVPRWSGDTNFMPVLAEVKVLPEHLKQSYKKLKKAWGLVS